jgi:predicted ATPase
VSEPEASRFRLFDELASFLRCASRERPIVLFLDDLHAADASSLLLLQFVARELASCRLLVMCAYRSVDPGPSESLAATLTELAREAVVRVIRLAGLSEQDVADYVALTAPDLATPELAGGLREETEGNPLFVAEIMRLLADEPDTPALHGGKFAVPQSVRSVIPGAWRTFPTSAGARWCLPPC